MIFVAVLGFLILLLLASWFVFALLGAVEKIVRGVHDGTPEDKIDVNSEGIQAAIALSLLFSILIWFVSRW